MSVCLHVLQVKWRKANSVAKYTADSLFSYYVIMTLTIMTWRSTLALYDIILAFDDPVTADIVSTVIGFLLCTLVFVAEEGLAKASVFFFWTQS